MGRFTPLAGSQLAADRDLADHGAIFDADNAQADRTVGQQDRVAGLDRPYEGLLVDGYAADVAVGAVGHQDELLSGLELHRSIGEVADPDLGPRQVL